MEQRCQQQRCVHVSRLVDMRLIFCCNHAKRPTSELTSRRHMNRRSSVSASPSSSSGSTLGTRIRRRIPLTFRRCIYRPFKLTVCRRCATLWRTSSSWWTLRSTSTANISKSQRKKLVAVKKLISSQLLKQKTDSKLSSICVQSFTRVTFLLWGTSHNNRATFVRISTYPLDLPPLPLSA